MPAYEYMCVPGPTSLVVKSIKDAPKAVQEYASILNGRAYDGWEYHSMETISVKQAPGCFKTSADPVVFYMLIFRREKGRGRGIKEIQ